jgi:cobalt/nickel transport system permease protein
LFVHGHGPLHRLSPQCKIVGALSFIVAVVLTPPTAYPAFAAYALIVIALARLGEVPLLTLAKRLVIELPFVAFALLLPFVGHGDKVEVLGLSVSSDGLLAAWNIIAKATVGAATSVILASTTQISDLLRGLDRLHVPRIITAIAGFMVRYSDVITGEMRRMRIARESRGYDPRWIWQARALATSAGTLFIRSFERGERVHLAMVSRGFTGSLPELEHHAATPREWVVTLMLPLAACGVMIAARAM